MKLVLLTAFGVGGATVIGALIGFVGAGGAGVTKLLPLQSMVPRPVSATFSQSSASSRQLARPRGSIAAFTRASAIGG